MTRSAVLTIEQISVGYGGTGILSGFSGAIDIGQRVGVVGRNGCGKSTLFKSIFGILRSEAGKITFAGKDITKISPQERRSAGMRYVPQGARIFNNLTVTENIEIAFWDYPADERELLKDSVLHRCRYSSAKAAILARSLSGGERQRLVLTCALSHKNTRLLLIDEPSIGLSAEALKETFTCIREINQSTDMSVLIIEHRLNEVIRFADRIWVLKEGKLSADLAASQTDERRLFELAYA